MMAKTFMLNVENLSSNEDVKKIKDVEPLSNALFPGYHCPLMGAMLTIKEIEDVPRNIFLMHLIV